jgi:hypothetical protein
VPTRPVGNPYIAERSVKRTIGASLDASRSAVQVIKGFNHRFGIEEERTLEEWRGALRRWRLAGCTLGHGRDHTFIFDKDGQLVVDISTVLADPLADGA